MSAAQAGRPTGRRGPKTDLIDLEDSLQTLIADDVTFVRLVLSSDEATWMEAARASAQSAEMEACHER